MFLLWRPCVISKTTAQRDAVTGKLVETVPCHALLLLLLVLWGHGILLKCPPIGPRALGVLQWSLQVRFEFSLSVKTSRAFGILSGRLLYKWWVWGSDLETNVVDSLSDHYHHLVLLVHQLLKPGVTRGRRANIPLEHHENHHEKSPP